MSADIPYMGSKISLISNAEIRYEGILYAIDAEESTVALAQVRFFGTEDRQTDNPIQPREDVFDYIIFRGKDIKDLHVCDPSNTSLAQTDPAIVESSMSSNNPASSTHQQQQIRNNPPTPGQQQQQGNSNHYMYMSPNSYPPSHQQQQQQQQQHHLQQQHMQQQPSVQPYPMYNAFGNNYLPFGGNQSTHSGSRTPSPGLTQHNHHHPPQHPSTPGMNHPGYNQAGDSRGGEGRRNTYYRGGPTARHPGNYSQAVTASNHHRDDFSRNDVNSQALRSIHQQQFFGKESELGMPRFPGESGGGYPRPPVSSFSNYEFRYSRGRAPHRGYYGVGMQRGGRGNGGGRGGPPRGYMGGGRGSFPRGRANTLNFDSEFDFESSNAKFDKFQIEKELKEKLNIENKDVCVEKEVEAGEMHNGAATAVVGEEEGGCLDDPSVVASSLDSNCYDKNKSFFDSISCEALDNKGHRRPNWKEERKLNFETFGLRGSSNYNHRYRGRNRGGYYNSNNRNAYGGNFFNRDQPPSFHRPSDRAWGGQPRGGRGKYNWYNSNKHDDNNNNNTTNSNPVTSKSTIAVKK